MNNLNDTQPHLFFLSNTARGEAIELIARSYNVDVVDYREQVNTHGFRGELYMLNAPVEQASLLCNEVSEALALMNCPARRVRLLTHKSGAHALEIVSNSPEPTPTEAHMSTQNNETHNPTDTGATQTQTRDEIRDEIRAKIETHEANLAELDAIFAECLANANTDADREGAEEIVRKTREMILAHHEAKIAELEAPTTPRQSERLTTRTIRGKSDELTALLDNVISTSLSPDMTQEMTKLFRRSRGEWQLTIVETMGDDREIVGVMFARSSVSQGYWAHSMLTHNARTASSLAVGKKWLREQMITA